MGRSLGLDIHQATVFVTGIDPQTMEVSRYEIAVEEKSLQTFEAQLRPDDRVAIESTTNAYYFYDRLCPLVAEVAVANPIKLRPWLGNEDKSDRNDSFWLALLHLFGCLPQIWVPDPETREDRKLLAHYSALVGERTRCKNRIRALLASHGLINPVSDLQGVAARDLVVQQNARLPETAKAILNSQLAALDSVQARLEPIEALVALRAHRRRETHLLLSVPGLELTLCLVVLAAIGNVGRFPTPGSLVKYAGLVPREKSSGGRSRRGGLKKNGSRSLRWALTEAVQSLIKQPGRFRNLYRRLVRKGHGIAIAACARKLLTIIWHMLNIGEHFREEKPDSRERKQNRVKRKVAKANTLITERRVMLENLLKHAPQLKELAGGRTGFPLSLRPILSTAKAPPMSTG